MATILLPLGGCESWFDRDSMESQARNSPDTPPEIKELLDMQKRSGRRYSQAPKADDPKFMEKTRKQSQRDQDLVLKQHAEAKKRLEKDLEKRKKEPPTTHNQDSSSNLFFPEHQTSQKQGDSP
jgi:hypothetical protein